MKNLITLITVLTLATNSLAADCIKPVQKVEEGSQAQCSGFLFSPEKELDVRVKSKEYDLIKSEVNTLNAIVDKLQKKNEDSDKIIQLEIEKSDLWRARAEDITLKYTSVEESRTKRDFMAMLLGVGLTVLAGYAVGQAAGR